MSLSKQFWLKKAVLAEKMIFSTPKDARRQPSLLIYVQGASLLDVLSFM
jgi:hypothetical protein